MTQTAAAGARDQVARLLALVPYLHSRGEVHLEEVAADLGVPPEQLLRDLKVLLMCGLPGGFPDDLIDVDLDALEGEGADGVVRVTNAEYLARPLRLSATEASAVIVALRALRESADEATRPVVDRALAKLEIAAAEAGAVAEVELGSERRAPDHSDLVTRLEAAVRAGKQVRLTYFVPSRDEVSERVVDPRGVVTADDHPYLDAYCHSAQAPRLFRLDRVQSAEVLERDVETEQVAPRDLSGGVLPAQHATTVTLRLAPSARWVVEYYDVLEVREDGDDLLVDLAVADERWLVRLMLRLAPHARVERPHELDERFLGAARLTLSAYGPRG
ncbi:helix-turn-helix transcriptional regulator [Nocardioides bruguierae]|uniref:helix-turn-helix transcriptional regulator n=1 Tax=Nocardioides bruguierae TaxID=2945102 RepID=UPI0020209995|nr:WYL domain-containing protein [Nocardioides bruguierae]MCL8025870.1 WYL domain-containing protein [Nocardioides bruguierae]